MVKLESVQRTLTPRNCRWIKGRKGKRMHAVEKLQNHEDDIIDIVIRGGADVITVPGEREKN